jgi:hypothetical protein
LLHRLHVGCRGKRERRGWGRAMPTPTVGSDRPPRRGEGSHRLLLPQLQQARVRPRKGFPSPPRYLPLPGSADGRRRNPRRAAPVPPPLRLRRLRGHRPLPDPGSIN